MASGVLTSPVNEGVSVLRKGIITIGFSAGGLSFTCADGVIVSFWGVLYTGAASLTMDTAGPAGASLMGVTAEVSGFFFNPPSVAGVTVSGVVARLNTDGRWHILSSASSTCSRWFLLSL